MGTKIDERTIIVDRKSFWKDENIILFDIVVWNKLFAKKLFDSIRFPFGKIHEDEFVIHHLVGQCNEIRLIPYVLYNYRERDDSLMHLAKKSFSKDSITIVQFYIDRINYYKNNNEVDMVIYNYQKALSLIIYLYRHHKKEILSEYKNLKDIYFFKKSLGIKTSFGEYTFFHFPIIYCKLRNI